MHKRLHALMEVVVAGTAFGIGAAPSADAAVSCSFASTLARPRVTVAAGGATATITRNASNQITMNGATCADAANGGVVATVTNTDDVVVTGTAGFEQVL